MDSKTEALRKLHSAGTINLISGVLNIVGSVACIAFGIVLIIVDTPISDPGEPVIESTYAGSLFLIIGFILAILGIFNIIASTKLRKPTSDPKPWVIYTIVAGALNVSSIVNILQIIFGIIAFSALAKVDPNEFSQAPAVSSAPDKKELK